jgi:DNA-binding NarL/FixJ family response regulator
MDDKISVIIVDDYELSRVGLRYMLKTIPYVESVKEATNSKELFDLVKKDEPDLILMDVNLDVEYGSNITEQLLRKLPNTFVIAITASKDIQHFIDMINAGALGFLLKNVTTEELKKAIDKVLKGEMYFSKEFLTAAKQLLPRHNKKSKIKLSDRESEVLKLICMGNSNQEIADSLKLSSHTIDAHRKKLLSKTGARNTASMIMISIRDGLIDLD